jgi:methionyl-tRNA formyltransferase
MSAEKILFAGTPEFARVLLCALVEANRAPALVLTQPDRPAGRGKKLTASPVKQYAVSQDIEVWQPATLKDPDVVAKLRGIEPDIIIVAAYGLILPQAVLDIPKLGCLNVHASLLPRWRGAAPIQQSILSGDEETGICLMRMEAGLDTGPVYASVTTPIGADDTAGALHDRLAELGGRLLVDRLDEILGGHLDAVPQVEAAATYAGKIRREDAAIDWNRDARQIQRCIRAYNPVPGTYFDLGGESIKCWKAEVVPGGSGQSGKIVAAGKAGVDVACGSGVLRLLEVQRPGRKRVTGAELAAQVNLADKRLS